MPRTKYNILFFTDRGPKIKGSDGTHYLRCRVRFCNECLYFNLGYKVNPDKWSTDTQRCVIGSFHGKRKVSASTINRHIQRTEEIIIRLFDSHDQNNTTPTKDDIKRAIGIKKDEDNDKDNFFKAYDDFTLYEGIARSWTRASYQKFEALKRHLIRYNPNITFADLSLEGLDNLMIYFRDQQQERNSTIIKRIGFIKWFLRWADAHGYKVNPAYKGYRFKLKEVEKTIVFLEWEELMTLYNADLNDTKSRIRDVFCFCAFTSLRYSDVASLTRSRVFSKHIMVVTQKTHDSLKIELNNYSKAILDKYKGIEFANDLALPIISSQKFNDRLKEIGKELEIDSPVSITYYKGNQRHDEVYPKWQLLTSHVARRTFISNALMMGIPPDVVMKWTGHSDYSAMKPYIAIADKAKADAMSLFDRR